MKFSFQRRLGVRAACGSDVIHIGKSRRAAYCWQNTRVARLCVACNAVHQADVPAAGIDFHPRKFRRRKDLPPRVDQRRAISPSVSVSRARKRALLMQRERNSARVAGRSPRAKYFRDRNRARKLRDDIGARREFLIRPQLARWK